MSESDAKAAFEKWAKSEGHNVDQDSNVFGSYYKSILVANLWGLWQLQGAALRSEVRRLTSHYGRACAKDGADCVGYKTSGKAGNVRDARVAIDQAVALLVARIPVETKQS